MAMTSDPMSPEEMERERQKEREYWKAEARLNYGIGLLVGILIGAFAMAIFLGTAS